MGLLSGLFGGKSESGSSIKSTILGLFLKVAIGLFAVGALKTAFNGEATDLQSFTKESAQNGLETGQQMASFVKDMYDTHGPKIG